MLKKKDFKGVSDFTVQSLTLNVVDMAQAAFSTIICLAKNCLYLSTLKRQKVRPSSKFRSNLGFGSSRI